MGPRYTSKYECFIGIQIYEAISLVMVTHTSAVDACDIMREILQDYEINHPVRTRIDRVWDALARWCTIRQATHERIRGALPATAQSLLPVIVPATHRVEIWAIAARGQRPARRSLDTVTVAQFVRGPLAPLQQHWMQLKKRHDDDEDHMRHLFFHD